MNKKESKEILGMNTNQNKKAHILERESEILRDLREGKANLDDVTQLLNYYDGKPVLINGIEHHPFNDPILARKLNAEYRKRTGYNHSKYVERVPVVIDRLMKDKDWLLRNTEYTIAYFEELQQIKDELKAAQDGKNREGKEINF